MLNSTFLIFFICWSFYLHQSSTSLLFAGYTLMHPSLTRPYLMTEPPLHTDIIHYENIPGFPAVRQNILRYEPMKEGAHSTVKKPRMFTASTSQARYDLHSVYFLAASLWAARSLPCPLTPRCPGTPIGSGTTAKMRTMSATPGSW